MTDWAPATEAETAMRDALRNDDQEQYFRRLAQAELLLPTSAGPAGAPGSGGWGTWTAAGRTHVLAFTSPEAMKLCLAEHAGASRRLTYPELAAAWPNLDWWLAVNPGLPIEGYLPAWFVSQVARGDTRLPGRGPAPGEPVEIPAQPTGVGAATGGAVPPAAPVENLGRAAVTPAGLPRRQPRSRSRYGQDSIPAQPAGFASAPPVTVPDPAPEPEPEPAVGIDPAEAWPEFTAANDLERALLAAVAGGRMDHFLSTLLLAKVMLPVAQGADPQLRPGQPGFSWRTDQRDSEPYVVVVTSPERLAEHLSEPPASLPIRFVQLIRSWPQESWSLLVNPGTPIEMNLSSRQIAALASSAAEVGLDDDAGEASETGAAEQGRSVSVPEPVPMQKPIAPSQVVWYLERSYDRVSGFVHREQEVAHLASPAQLTAGLGLRYEGSSFAADATEIYVLRWPAHRPSLYRIPYGGRSAEAMAAMEGWVIERPPFRGNGFAPSESDDVIAEFKVDSIRLPHGAQLWRLTEDGAAELVATLDADGPSWQRSGES